MTDNSAPIVRLFPPQYPGVAVGSTPQFVAVIVDGTGTPVPASALNALTLSIIDTTSGSVINNCSQVSILNTGRGTVDSSGNLTIVLLPGDTMLFNVQDQTEERSLVIDYVYDTSTRVGRFEQRFIIVQLSGL